MVRPRQMRSVKTNASEPLMKGGKYFQTMSKPGYGHDSGSNVGQDLKATDVASGLEAARARNRLEHGSFEKSRPDVKGAVQAR